MYRKGTESNPVATPINLVCAYCHCTVVGFTLSGGRPDRFCAPTSASIRAGRSAGNEFIRQAVESAVKLAEMAKAHADKAD